MIQNLFPHLLTDANEYSLAEQYWRDLWAQLPSFDRLGWKTPWLQSDGDGNPIFSAFSPDRKKAIRVVQFEPVTDELDFGCYTDRIGGGLSDRNAIQELVIACSLSREAEFYSRRLISAWLTGDIELSKVSEQSPVRIGRTGFSGAMRAEELIAEAA
jgi:hypothetical protein